MRRGQTQPDAPAGRGLGRGKMRRRETGGAFMRFTIRDLLWLMVVTAMAVAIWANNYRHGKQVATMNELVDQLRRESKVWERRANALRNDLTRGTNKNTEVEFIPDGIRYIP